MLSQMDEDFMTASYGVPAMVQAVLEADEEFREIEANNGRLVGDLPQDQWLITELSVIGSANASLGKMRISTPGHKLSPTLLCYIWTLPEVTDVLVADGENVFDSEYAIIDTTNEVTTALRILSMYNYQVQFAPGAGCKQKAIEILNATRDKGLESS